MSIQVVLQEIVANYNDGQVVELGNHRWYFYHITSPHSEIFAAAIQDYGRGIVLGSTSTYGKGTVQRAYGLDPESNFMSSNSDLGSIKLTLQKFYRIDGGSTEHLARFDHQVLSPRHHSSPVTASRTVFL